MKVKFKLPQQNFYLILKAQVDAYFQENKLSPNANSLMVFKSVLFFSLLLGIYLAILLSGLSWPLLLIGACLLGFVTAEIGFNVAHDAVHGSYSSRPWLNKTLSFSFNLIGGNNYVWNITHNIVHHTYTNIPGHDEDLELIPLIRLSPHAKKFKIHRFQQWYAFFFYSFSTLSWVLLKDYKKFFQKKIGNYDNKKHALSEYFILFSTKALYYFLFLFLPWIILPFPFWGILIGFVAMHLVAGLTLAIVFQLAHVVEGPEFDVPAADGSMNNSWVVHQLRTTANFSRNSAIANFLLGGLNFQIEHHLFPRVCHVHYRAISRIVKETAHKHDLPYHEKPSFFEALRSHYRMLRKLGVSAGE